MIYQNAQRAETPTRDVIERRYCAPRNRSSYTHGRRKPHARVRVVAVFMAPPVRERDDTEGAAIDAGDVEEKARPPRGPVKAPRLEKSATAPPTRGATTVSTLRAFARRENLMSTPGSTSGLTSSGERTPATSNLSRTRVALSATWTNT